MKDSDFYYDLRHLKDFRKLSGNENTVWRYRWKDGGDVEVYKQKDGVTMFTLGHDVHLAQYICDLNNLSKKMIKEVESKYGV